MSILQARANRVVDLLHDAFSMGASDADYMLRTEVQSMIWDLGGRNLPEGASLSAATNYLLMLWFARGCP